MSVRPRFEIARLIRGRWYVCDVCHRTGFTQSSWHRCPVDEAHGLTLIPLFALPTPPEKTVAALRGGDWRC